MGENCKELALERSSHCTLSSVHRIPYIDQILVPYSDPNAIIEITQTTIKSNPMGPIARQNSEPKNRPQLDPAARYPDADP